MRKGLVGVLTVGASAALALSACVGSSSGDATLGASRSRPSAVTSGGKVGVILPDTRSSVRWETADRRFLKDAFDAAGVEADIQNAGGDKTRFVSIADRMIASGVKVLMIVNLDSDTGAAVIKKAGDVGIPVIDYDRLTLGGGAAYYVSFDNLAVGTAIGEGLVRGLKEAGKTTGKVVLLNGSPTDNNATLLKHGYETVIKAAGFTVAADQSVPDWDYTKAGMIFDQIYAESKGDFVGVAAANDSLGGAVVAVLQRKGRAGLIPVTGQDATDEGLQRVLLGTQYVTVYKALRKEAEVAAALAIRLIRGDTAGADAAASGTVTDPRSGRDVKSVLLPPEPIYKDTVKRVIADGFTTKEKVCTSADLQKACAANGIR